VKSILQRATGGTDQGFPAHFWALTAIANLTTEVLSFEDPINQMTINDLSIFITRVNEN
jgi:hypothetical protein